MKFIVDNWMLILVAISSGGLLMWPVIKGSATSGLSTAEAVQLINREKAVVIDVCQNDEFAAGHVGGAKHAPFDQLNQKLPELVKNKSTQLIFVCQSGIRSSKAIAVAKSLGYEQSHSISGGLTSWRAANLPIEKS